LEVPPVIFQIGLAAPLKGRATLVHYIDPPVHDRTGRESRLAKTEGDRDEGFLSFNTCSEDKTAVPDHLSAFLCCSIWGRSRWEGWRGGF
jgi:hypothetical protein